MGVARSALALKVSSFYQLAEIQARNDNFEIAKKTFNDADALRVRHSFTTEETGWDKSQIDRVGQAISRGVANKGRRSS